MNATALTAVCAMFALLLAITVYQLLKTNRIVSDLQDAVRDIDRARSNDADRLRKGAHVLGCEVSAIVEHLGVTVERFDGTPPGMKCVKKPRAAK